MKDDTKIENDISIDNDFNNYFASIASLAKAKLNNSSNSNVSTYLKNYCNASLYLHPTHEMK